MALRDEPVEFNVEVKAATERALLCDIDGEEHWIPRSQVIADGTDVNERGDEGALVLTRWICEQKGLV